jgi:hypothetical protein
VRLTKMLGLALFTAVVMSAVTASAASAAEFFHEGEGLARVTAKNEGTHKFTAGIIGTIECKKATFTGTSYVPSPQTTLTVEPAYSECTFLGVSGVVVKTNGCTYTFNQPTGTGPFTGTVTVNCPVGKSIEFEATGCKISVGAQGPLSSVTYTNLATTPKSVKVAANATKIKYTASGTCVVLGQKEDGSYTGTAISDAETEGGELVGGFIK